MRVSSVERGLVRKLWTGDTSQLLEHFMRLDDESRARRFMGLVSDQHIERHAQRAIRADTVIYGYFEQGILRGAAELHPMRGASSGEAEGAFSVERDWQRKGVGARLFREILSAARKRAVTRLTLNCLPGNRAMQQLCRRFGAKVRVKGGEAIAHLDGIAPTPSRMTGAIASGFSSLWAKLTAARAA